MKYYVYNSRRKEMNPIHAISESGVTYIASNGARVTMELTRSWNRRVLSFFREAELEEIMKEINPREERKVETDLDKASYKDLQALAREKGINPFGMKKQDLLNELKK